MFRSKSSDVNISTWPLPPLPLEQECTNFSFTVSVALQAHHYAIESIYLNVSKPTSNIFLSFTVIILFLLSLQQGLNISTAKNRVYLLFHLYSISQLGLSNSH